MMKNNYVNYFLIKGVLTMKIKLWDNVIPYYNENYDNPNLMTPYLIETYHKVPTIIVLPGGGYSSRADHEGKPIAEFYNSKGFNAFVVDYRVLPNKFPCAIADAQRAIKIIKSRADEFHVDTDRIFVIGFSAGGHLASSIATMDDYSKIGDELDEISPTVTGAILSYPVISGYSEDGWICCCLESITEDTDTTAHSISTHKLVSEATPPCFIWHTAEDETVDLVHSLKMTQALKEKSVPVELHVFPKGPHGLGLAQATKDVSKWPELSADWIKNNF